MNAVVQNECLANERNDEWEVERVELLPGHNNRNKAQKTLGDMKIGGNTIVSKQETTMRRTLRSSNPLRITLPVNPLHGVLRPFPLQQIFPN